VKQSKQIAINTFSSWAALLTATAVMIFLSKFLLNRLGTERFGMFRYVLTIQGSLMFMDLGLAATLNRLTSQSLTLKDYNQLNATTSFGFLMFFGLGILAGAVMAVLGYVLPSLVVGGTAELYAKGFPLMCCIGGMLALRFWGYSARGLLQGAQRYDLVNVTWTAGSVLRAGLVAVLFLKVPSSGLVTIGLCFLISAVLETILMWTFAKQQNPALRLSVSLVTKDTVKEVTGFSVFVLVMAVTTVLIWNAPMFLAGRLYGPEAVAFLSLPLLLLGQIQQGAEGFSFSLLPAASRYNALGKTEMLKKLTLTGTKYCAMLCFPISAIVTILGHPILEWFKEGFGWTWILLAILMVPYLMRGTQTSTAAILMGARSIRRLAVGQVALVVVIALAAWLFGEYLKMELYGVTLGTAIPLLLFSALFQTKYACDQIGIKWLSYMRQSYGKVTLGTIPAAVAAVVLVRYFYPKTLAMIAAECLVCLLVFAVFAWWLVMDIEERKQIRSVFRI